MHILFVTPHLSDADLVQRRLQRSLPGVRLDACGVPDQARARILTVLHEAVVVDVLAFGESGLQLIAECRARAPQQLVIALTRTAGEEDAAMAAVAGATTSIAKEGGWLEPLAEALLGPAPPSPAPLPVETVAAAVSAPPTVAAPRAAVAEAPAEVEPAERANAGDAAAPPEMAAQVARLQHALDQEVAIRRDAEARARNLAAAHDADRQRWQLSLRQLEERYTTITQQQAQRSDLEAAFESVEQRYMALLEERRRDQRQLEVLEEQALRQREAAERVEAERDRLARELGAAQAGQARRQDEGARLAEQHDDVRQRCAALEAQRAELASQLSRATDDLRQAADHGAAIQAALARAERDQQEAHAQLEALRRRAEADAASLAERDARVAELERALEARPPEAPPPPAPAVLDVLGVATTTTDGVLLRTTDAFARACGFESAAAQLAAGHGRRVPFLAVPDDLARRLADRAIPRRHEARLRHPDGRSTWVVATAVPAAQGDTVDWVIHDVTDSPLARAQRRRLRRLDAACALAQDAGTAIVEHGGPAAQEDGVLLRQIVEYARHQARAEELTDLAELLGSVRPAIQRAAGAGVDVRVEPAPSPLLAEVGRDEAEDLVLGAALALREALPLGGRLTVRAWPLDGEAEGAEPAALAPFARVALLAEGHGVQGAEAPRALRDRLAALGGRARCGQGSGPATRLEIDLPIAIALSASQ